MPRKTNRTVILAKIEATAGTDAAPAAADALLIGDNSFDVEYKNVDRNLIRPTMGHGGTLVGTRNVKIDITIELSTSGTAGTAPPWGKLLLACAFAEVVTAATMVEYTPVSDGLKTLTIKYSKDGVIHTALGCMGTVSFEEPEGDRPTLKFSFGGIDGGSVAAASSEDSVTAWYRSRLPWWLSKNSPLCCVGFDVSTVEVEPFDPPARLPSIASKIVAATPDASSMRYLIHAPETPAARLSAAPPPSRKLLSFLAGSNWANLERT